MRCNNKQIGTLAGDHIQPAGPANNRKVYNMKNKPLTSFQLLERIVTAVNIATGDDGSKAKKVIDNFCLFLKMDEKEYKEQQKYYG